MKITERFEALIPNSKCYWNSGSNQLSVHVIDNPSITKSTVEHTVISTLDKIGMLSAVESIRVICY